MTDQTQTPAPQPTAPQTVVNVSMRNTNTAVAQAKAEAQAVAAAPAPSPPPPPQVKSLVAAYLYWALTGFIGWHRYYLRRPVGLWLFLLAGLVMAAIVVPAPLVLLGAGALLAADFVEIPGWVRQHNKVVVAVREGTKAEKKKVKDLRTLLLNEAHAGDGRLTVTQGVMASGMDWELVETCLRDMVQAGYVDVDNEPNSGVIVYVFPELVGRPLATSAASLPEGPA